MVPSLPDEQAALLAAIAADPDEDTPRLVYADWLQEHGDDEQAQFIRDSVALEWLNDYEDEKRQRVARRLDGTAFRNGSRWLAAVGVVGPEPVYDRGLVDELIYSDANAFVADAPVLCARVPVRAVTVHGLTTNELDPDWLSVFSTMPCLERLQALRLSNAGYPVSADGWAQFIQSPYLANLRTLVLHGAALTDDDMLVFERCDHLAALEELGLAANRLTAVGALAVVRASRLPRLTRLGLASNDIEVDRRRGSAYLALVRALHERFDGAHALGLSL